MKKLLFLLSFLFSLALGALVNAISYADHSGNLSRCAVTQNPLIGRTSGKYGGTIFSKIFGKNVIRTKPVTVRNPKTTGQTDQRTKFSLIQDIMRDALQAVKVGFKAYADGMSAFNYAIKVGLRDAISGSTGNWSIDFAKLSFSAGNVDPDSGFAVVYSSGTSLEVTWDVTSGSPGSLGTDKVSIVLVTTSSDLSNKVKSIVLGADRDDGSITVEIPGTFMEDALEVYAFFSTADGSESSSTTYIDEVNPTT